MSDDLWTTSLTSPNLRIPLTGVIHEEVYDTKRHQLSQIQIGSAELPSWEDLREIILPTPDGLSHWGAKPIVIEHDDLVMLSLAFDRIEVRECHCYHVRGRINGCYTRTERQPQKSLAKSHRFHRFSGTLDARFPMLDIKIRATSKTPQNDEMNFVRRHWRRQAA